MTWWRSIGVAPYFEDESCVLYHGDARHLLPRMRDESVAHCLTDPPYGFVTRAGARTNPKSAKRGAPAPAPFVIGYPALHQALVECARIARRWVIGTFDYKHTARLEQATPWGLRFVRAGVWVKPDSAPQFNGKGPAPGWESIAIMHRAGVSLRWHGGGGRAVYTHGVERRVMYPTAKPLGLYLELLRLFADSGDTILDPFAGSGTTGVTARALGMKAVLIERDRKACDLIVQRVTSPLEQARCRILLPASGSAGIDGVPRPLDHAAAERTVAGFERLCALASEMDGLP